MINFLLASKLYIPSTRPTLVPRPRLIEKLNTGLHRKLTLISAPAGFGKTTLVADWLGKIRLDAARSNGDQTRIAWFSLDENDNDLARFLAYMITAINQAGSNGMGETALKLLQPPQPAPTETILAALVNEIMVTNTRIILVLEDYHRAEAQSINDSIRFWLENLPPQIHLVIITREDPYLPLARLRARDQLTELRAADLRFTESEAAVFLNEIMSLHLDENSVGVLAARTEGWITGLQMAALSMRDRKDLNGFIAGFSGTNRYILDYLLEEVLANQPPEIQHFLLNTSILDRLSVPLCETVLGKVDQQQGLRADQSAPFNSHSLPMLEYLDQLNLFLVPLDDERHWFRYHHLFADLLHARLQQTRTSEEVNCLHTRAAQWFEQNGFAYEAIHHASIVADDAWVERLIEQNYMEMFQRRDSASIRAWTGELSKDLILKSPKLSIHEAMSLSWAGRLDEAALMLNEAEKRLLAKPISTETQVLLAHLAYVRSRVTAMQGNFQQAIAMCLKARNNTPASNHALLGGIGVMLGYGYFLAGDFENAAQTLIETIQAGIASGAVNTTIGAYCVLARLYAHKGQLQRSLEVYQSANKFALDMGGQHRGAMSIIDVGFAEIHYERNDLESALAYIKQGLEFIELWGKADDIALAHTIHARIQFAQENLAGAVEAITEGKQVIHSHGVFSEARDAVTAAEIQLLLARQDSLGISTWVNSVEKLLFSDNAFQFENELTHLTLAKVYTAQNRLDEAITLLSRLEYNAKSSSRTGRLIHLTILKALVQQAKGNTEEAAAALSHSLSMAETDGYARVFLDEGRPMQELLCSWLSHSNSSSLQNYATHLLCQFDPIPLSPSTSVLSEILPSTAVLVEPLSPRELEVLGLIALGKTNKDIAEQLFVSPGTVKAHTSSIYRKLDVANRTEAVARARQLALIIT